MTSKTVAAFIARCRDLDVKLQIVHGRSAGSRARLEITGARKLSEDERDFSRVNAGAIVKALKIEESKATKPEETTPVEIDEIVIEGRRVVVTDAAIRRAYAPIGDETLADWDAGRIPRADAVAFVRRRLEQQAALSTGQCWWDV
jgi:hypothetical protein